MSDNHDHSDSVNVGFRFEPSVSWGDVGMAVTLLIAGVLAFAVHDKRLTVHDEQIAVAREHTKTVAQDLRQHVADSAAKDLAVRNEIRIELKGIHDKLDRLIERELNRNGNTNGN